MLADDCHRLCENLPDGMRCIFGNPADRSRYNWCSQGEAKCEHLLQCRNARFQTVCRVVSPSRRKPQGGKCEAKRLDEMQKFASAGRRQAIRCQIAQCVDLHTLDAQLSRFAQCLTER